MAHPAKGQTFPTESLQRVEVESLLNAADDGTWYGKRNHALIVLLWRSGLRISEALALRKNDVDWNARAIRVLRGKGSKMRTVGIDAEAIAVLQEMASTHESSYLICTRAGKPLSSPYVRVMLNRLAKKAGVTRRVHPHIFRHTFAVELVREGVSMPLIQRLLGHSSLAVTSAYLESLSPEEALNAVRGRVW